jgi:hypothetical protein
MATVRISGNWRNRGKKEWAGTPAVDPDGHIERSIAIPEEAYQAIEHELKKGGVEGIIYLEDGTQFNWFLDR